MTDTNYPVQNDTIYLYDDGIGRVQLIDHMGCDKDIVNAARVSFGADNDLPIDERDEKLIGYLLKNKHTSPFEHCTIKWKFVVPLFVRGQHHRHRTWCLSGDTEITFNRPDRWRKGVHTKQSPYSKEGFTLRELYRKWETNGGRETIKNMLVRVYDEKEKKFTVSSIENVIYSGKKDVFEVELEDGKTLKCSKDHRLLTTYGWQRLEDAVGLEVSSTGLTSMTKECYVLTNGVSAWRSYDWMKAQRDKGRSVSEIAEEAGCSYHTIRKWLKIHGLQFDQLEALRRHNEENGPWNRGKFGYKLDKKPMTQEHREAIKAARSGPNSNFWKGGVTEDRAAIGRWTTGNAAKVHAKYNYTCQRCFKKGGTLHAHHIKPVVSHPGIARDLNNLESLCKTCHIAEHLQTGEIRMGYGTPLAAKASKIRCVRYVGVEETYDIEIKGPNHNFVANGMVVHNSYNEISRRYTSENLQFYCPKTFRTQHEKNRQASNDVEENPHIYNWDGCGIIRADKALEYAVQNQVELYEKMLEAGICREQARMVLPQNLYTEFYGTVNLHNAMHFLRLRLGPHAQWEIRRVAEAMRSHLEELFPVAMSSFGQTLSPEIK